MKTLIKAAVIAFSGLGALALPAGAQPDDPYYGNNDDQGYGAYDQGPYDQPYAQPYGQPYAQPYVQPYGAPAYDDPYADNYYGSDYGYCDPYYGCPDDFYDLPLYYGSVFYDGAWLNGPFYYRDYGGRRQFWTHGGWHDGNYRGGRFGPALGRSFYQNHAYAGRGFGGGGYRNFGSAGNWSRSYGTNVYRGSGNAYRGSGDFNRGSFQRPAFQGQSFQGQNFQRQQSFGGGGGWRGRFQNGGAQAAPQQQRFGGTWNDGGWRGRGFQGQTQQAAPQQRFSAGSLQNNGGGWHGGGGGGFRGQAQSNSGGGGRGGDGGGHGGGFGHHR